jgi:adenylate cyclase
VIGLTTCHFCQIPTRRQEGTIDGRTRPEKAEDMHLAVGEARKVRSSAVVARERVPTSEAALEQLERILASTDFDASPRSRAFVRFILEETLAGRQQGLTQTAIATRVFGRREDFDPTVDPIVRIQAGRLRRSLERYYLMSGSGDPIRIQLPRGTYVPVVGWTPRADEPASGRKAPVESRDGWPAVVVRIFETDGPEFEAAAVRIHEQLCLELGRYGDVRIVQRREPVGRGRAPCEDGDFELSGRVTGDAGSPRVTALLLECRTATQAWAEGYRAAPGAADDALEDAARRIAARVASEQGIVARQLWSEQRQQPAAELTPYAAILRSYRFFFHRDPADFEPARQALLRAVRERPECGLAWVQLSRLYISNCGFELTPAETPIDEAIAFAQTGVRLDPSSQRAQAALAGALLMKGELAAGCVEAEKAYALDPDSYVYLEWVGWLLALGGEWERGTALVRRSMERNPGHISVAVHALWADHVRRGEYEESYRVALLLKDGAFFWRALMRASSLGLLGREEEAKREADELLRLKPGFAGRGRILIGRYIKLPELFERVVDGLGKAGLTLD